MFKNRLGGLRGQLLRNFLLVILLSVGVLALVIQSASFRRVDQIGEIVSRQFGAQLATLLADHYAQTGSWEDIDPLLATFIDAPSTATDLTAVGPFWPDNLPTLFAIKRLIIADNAGQVITDTAELSAIGAPIPPDLASRAVPILSAGEPVGQLSLSINETGELATVIRRMFQRILWGGGLLAVSVAVLLSLGLSYRVAEPVRQLRTAAQKLAEGTAVSPLPVYREDELGDLTHSFNTMNDALAAQKRYRQQMTADIAHELRTPLSIMQLNVEGLADGLQTPEQASHALRGEITALARLIDDLRLLSTAEAGGLQLEMEGVEIRPFLSDIVDAWQNQTQQLNLQFNLPASPQLVHADRVRLAQIMNNLISNALRYSPDGEAIEVGAKIEADELVMWVSNKGEGIPPEALPHLFERFYRVDGSRSRETGGTGLGLAIVQRLVGVLNGRVWVESDSDDGTVFFIAFATYMKG